MANRKTSKENVKRHTLCFAPDFWESFAEISSELGLKGKGRDGISKLFRAFQLAYKENKEVLEPIMKTVVNQHRLASTGNVKPIKKSELKSLIERAREINNI